MKYFNLLFIHLFLASAFLQLNDEDPPLWFAIYLSGVAICMLSILQKGSFIFFTIALLAYLVFTVILFFAPDGVWRWFSELNADNIAQSMKARKP